jgi:tetratricopeptide (TPR) repeat protein
MFFAHWNGGLTLNRKSELAREIAVHAIATSPHLLIFWLDGSTAHNFHTQFQRMLRPNTESEATSKFLTAEYVKERLESIDSPPWLMIIDNACSDTFFNHEEMHRLIPNTIRGRILITSRNRSLARRLSPQAHIVDMHGMGDNDARNLFYSRFSRDRCHKEDVDALLRAVGCLPFAIIQAAQVITSRNMDIQQYLHILYSNSFTPSGSVASGFEITTHPKPRDDNSSIICLKSLDEENPQAIRLLATLSLLHDQSLPADIPKKLANEVQAIDALSVLTDYDLIKPGYKNNTLDLNLLVRVLVRSKLPYMVGTNEIIWPLLNILDRQFPTAFWNPDCLDQGQRYLAHVASFIDSLVQLYSLKLPCKDMISQVALLVSRLVYLLRDLSLYDQAKSTSEKALSWLSRQEPSPMRFSNILLNHLAALEYRMGHYEVASMILDRHLKIRLCLHVEGNLEIIRTLNTLALVKQGQGELDDALEIHRRVRSMKDRLLGVGHIGTLSTLTNLGLCLQAQGKHVEAECLMRKVLDERKQRLGLYNLLTLKSMSNLATSLQLQGRYLEAEELYRVSLDGGQSLLAEDHHDVLRRKYNLATVLHYQNKTDSAEKEYRGLTAAFEHKFGLDHPETITVYEGLASLLPNLEEAEETMKKIIPSVQRSYGKRHARTLGALYHLSILLYHQNKFSEALLLGIEILEVRQKDLGPHHSDTRAALEYVKDLRSCVQPIDEKLVSGSEVLQLYENSRKVRLGRFMGFKLQMRYSPFLPVIYFLATLALVVLICYMSF